MVLGGRSASVSNIKENCYGKSSSVQQTESLYKEATLNFVSSYGRIES